MSKYTELTKKIKAENPTMAWKDVQKLASGQIKSITNISENKSLPWVKFDYADIELHVPTGKQDDFVTRGNEIMVFDKIHGRKLAQFVRVNHICLLAIHSIDGIVLNDVTHYLPLSDPE